MREGERRNNEEKERRKEARTRREGRSNMHTDHKDNTTVCAVINQGNQLLTQCVIILGFQEVKL